MVAGLQVAQVVFLARILEPSDFGLMAVVSAIVAVLALFVDMGLSRALIHFDSVSRHALSSLYWINMMMAVAFMVLLAAAAPAIASFYREASLVGVLQVASLVFPFTALGQQFRALAEKELRFAELAQMEMVSAFGGFATALLIALFGGGVYSLVVGTVSAAATRSLLAWHRLSAGYRPALRINVREVLPYLRYGGYMVGDNVASSLHRQADVFVAGQVLGPGAIGAFVVPRDLSMRIVALINPIITRIGFPVMSRIKDDQARLSTVYQQTLRMTASVNFPIYTALGLFAEEIVGLLYGPQWERAALYLQILAVWGLVRSTSNPVGSLLYAVGKAKRAFWWNLILLLMLPAMYWVSVVQGGLPGMAIGMVLAQLALVVPAWFLLVRPCCGLSLSAYAWSLIVPLLLSVAAGLIAWLASRGVQGLGRLTVAGATGGVSYFVLSWLFNREWAEAMLSLLRTRRANAA